MESARKGRAINGIGVTKVDTKAGTTQLYGLPEAGRIAAASKENA